MLKTRVIPCMLFNGLSLVKTIQFGTMRNLGNPVQAAKVYNSRHVDELIFIDLTATVEKRKPLFEVIRDVARECFMPLTVGGGIHQLEDINKILEVGADKIAINSEALARPDFITQAAQKFGSQCVVVSIDAKKQDSDYYVFKNRGREATGKTVVALAKEAEARGAGEIFLNSIDRDGTMENYDLELIAKTVSAVSIPVIACGGAGKVQDIIDAIKIGGTDAVALASMFHYSGHTANSIKQRMATAGISVRLIKNL